jgi:glycosyltransferase involved in cell wall biosynthesis
MIIASEGSTDATTAFLDEIDDARIRLIHQHNGGVTAETNTALDAAQGRYVTFFGADNRLLPDALAVRTRFFDDHPQGSQRTQINRQSTTQLRPCPQSRSRHSGSGGAQTGAVPGDLASVRVGHRRLSPRVMFDKLKVTGQDIDRLPADCAHDSKRVMAVGQQVLSSPDAQRMSADGIDDLRVKVHGPRRLLDQVLDEDALGLALGLALRRYRTRSPA